MGNVVSKERCPSCSSAGNDTSGDNLIVYEDGGKYCFACNYAEISENYKQEWELMGKPFTDEVKEYVRSLNTNPDGYRGLTQETCRVYNTRNEYKDGELYAQYYLATQGYKASGFKLRILPKSFDSYGVTGKACEMFGQYAFRNSNSKTVVVVGGECFKPDTEVLTKEGFVKFGDLNGSEHVAQIVGDEIEYVKPLNFINKDYSGKMVKIGSKRFSINCTENHNLVYYDVNDNLMKVPANETIHNTRFFKGFGYQNGEGTGLTKNQIALIIAVAADAKYDVRKSGKVRFHMEFIKQRKADRMMLILNSLNIPYTSYINTYESTGKTYTTFNFDKPDFMAGKGIPSDWISSTSIEEKKFILDEMVEWDGNKVKGRDHFEFSSKSLHEASVIQIIAISVGYTATLRKRENVYGEWYSVTVVMKEGNTYSSQNVERNKEFYDYSGRVHCVTVPSGVIIIRENGRVVRVGNCDAMSAYQMLYNSQKSKEYEAIPVVSSTIGEGGTAAQLAAQYEWLNRFEKVILCLDNDDAGRKATEECVAALPKGKAYKMDLTLKDANEYLTSFREREFVQAFWSAKQIVPAGVVGSHELYDEMLKVASSEKIPLPRFMKRLENMLGGGFTLGHIINFASSSGVGKTSVVNEMLYFWMYNCPYKLGVVSMELNAGQYGLAMLSRHTGVKINKMSSDEQVEFLSRESTIAAAKELLCDENGKDRWMLVDDRDGTVDQIKGVIESLIISCGCQIIVLDPMSDIIEGLTNEEQALFIKWQKGMIKSHNVTFVNICHTRKTGGGEKAGSEGALLTEESIFGSSSIFKSSSANILFSRNKYAEDQVERNTISVRLSKNRSVGETGDAGKWFYDFETSTLYDYDDWSSKQNAIVRDMDYNPIDSFEVGGVVFDAG